MEHQQNKWSELAIFMNISTYHYFYKYLSHTPMYIHNMRQICLKKLSPSIFTMCPFLSRPCLIQVFCNHFYPLVYAFLVLFYFPFCSLPPFFNHPHLQNYFHHKYWFLLFTGSHHSGFIFLPVLFWIQLLMLLYFVTSIPDAMLRSETQVALY